MTIGMCPTGLAYVVMFFAGRAGGDTGRVSPWWLIGAYGVITAVALVLAVLLRPLERAMPGV
jgi:dipeptide/tripeptide permease